MRNSTTTSLRTQYCSVCEKWLHKNCPISSKPRIWHGRHQCSEIFEKLTKTRRKWVVSYWYRKLIILLLPFYLKLHYPALHYMTDILHHPICQRCPLAHIRSFYYCGKMESVVYKGIDCHSKNSATHPLHTQTYIMLQFLFVKNGTE